MSKEGVAKVLSPEKSMIVRPCASGSDAATTHSTRPIPCGLGEKKGRAWPQKGDFSGQSTFATSSKNLIKIVAPSDEGTTLLAFLRHHCKQAPSVKAIKRAIDSKSCRVNGRIETFSSHLLQSGDRVHFDVSGLNAQQETGKIKVLFEDESLIICNKPAGLISDNKPINESLPQYLGKLLLVHRLDKETSGVLILAKTPVVLEKMIALFQEHRVHKRYLALVDGVIAKEHGTIDNYLGKKGAYQGQTIHGVVAPTKGQRAVTLWKCLKRHSTSTLLLAEPVTGRTHQLRVHFSHIGHPILGDAQYGKTFKCSLTPKRHLLHAYSIRFPHPMTSQKIEVIAPIPSEFDCCN